MSANVNHNTLENTVNKVSPQVIISTDCRKYVSLCSNWVRNTFTSAAHVRVRSNHFHHIEYCGRVVATQAIRKVSREPVAMYSRRRDLTSISRERSIGPKIPVWISEILVCQMERYFRSCSTSARAHFLPRTYSTKCWRIVIKWSGFPKCRKLLHLGKFNRHSEFNSSFAFVENQEQAPTVVDHFASSVVSTRKTCRHLVAFHD